MNDTTSIQTTIQTKSDQCIELGTWLGRKQAFATLAGRCSAADAECLRQIRNGRMHRTLKMSWREFCKQRLGISRTVADLTIQRLEEFGPQYFTLAQATGIKPEEYRRIQGSVRGHALLHAGEEIPIQAENAPRLAAAVKELRREAEPEQAGTEAGEVARDLDKFERAFAAVVTEMERLHRLRLEERQRQRMEQILLDQLRRMPLLRAF